MSKVNRGVLAAAIGLSLCSSPMMAAQPADAVLCHQPGKPAQRTLTLPQPAASAHVLAHGDLWGSCDGAIVPPGTGVTFEILACAATASASQIPSPRIPTRSCRSSRASP